LNDVPQVLTASIIREPAVKEQRELTGFVLKRVLVNDLLLKP
jgi:hypothetical protein